MNPSKLVVDYSINLMGWCVYEEAWGTFAIRRSRPMWTREEAEALLAAWEQEQRRGLVPGYHF